MSELKTASDHVSALLHALPTPDIVSNASDEDLRRFRNLSNMLDNIAYLEVLKRKDAAKAVQS